MYGSRLCGILIDCYGTGIEEAAGFWGRALGRALGANHP
jgi:hypothetical protein